MLGHSARLKSRVHPVGHWDISLPRVLACQCPPLADPYSSEVARLGRLLRATRGAVRASYLDPFGRPGHLAHCMVQIVSLDRNTSQSKTRRRARLPISPAISLLRRRSNLPCHHTSKCVLFISTLHRRGFRRSSAPKVLLGRQMAGEQLEIFDIPSEGIGMTRDRTHPMPNPTE